MKTILAKFRRVTRYGVAVFLAAASCFSAFSEIICTPGEPYQQGTQWYVDVYCHGDIDPVHTTVPIDADPGSGGGSCTNCTAMSPAACQSIKSSIIEQCSILKEDLQFCSFYASSLQEQADSAMADISGLFEEGFNFYSFGESASGLSYSDLFNTSTVQYYPGFQDSEEETRAAYYGANEGVYHYFQSSVVPVLTSVMGQLDQINSTLPTISSVTEESLAIVSVLEAVGAAMDCSACEGSGGGGGGGGGTSGGGTTPSGCPCSEYINAVKTAVDNCHTKLTEIKSKLNEIKDKMDEWDKLLKGYKDQLETIAHGVAYIGTNFLHAVQLTDLQGTQIKMAELDKLLHDSNNGSFKQNEYAKLSWFSRVEYLLGTIAGVFSVTNKETNISDSSITEAYSGVADQKDSVESDVNTLQGKFDTLHDTFKNFFSSFKSAYTGAGSSSTSFNLFESWFDGKGLVVHIDGTVCHVARTITSLLWTLSFSFLLYNIVLYGLKYFAFVFKFWLAQITQFAK